jgi:hypothetical protein
LISIDEQRALLDYYYRSFAPDIALASDADLTGTGLSSAQPLALLDLSGQPLFYDFDIQGAGGTRAGVIRSSARGTEFPMLDSIMIGKQLFEPGDAITRAVSQAGIDYPGGTIGKTSFVCYGYPRVGVLVPVQAKEKQLSVVYDAPSGYLVKTWEGPYSPPESGSPPPEETEGEPFYSYLDCVPEGAAPGITAQWSSAIAFFEQSITAGRLEFAEIRETAMAARKPVIRGALLPVPLFGQQTPVYCAVATAKMILEYLGYTGHSQEEIAQAMGTGPDGTSNAGMVAGFKKLTNNEWSEQIDMSPSFDKSQTFLAQSLPAKSAISGHARALRGWREYLYLDSRTGTVSHTERFYIINDPYPVNEGQLVMENLQKPISDYYRNILCPVRSPQPVS